MSISNDACWCLRPRTNGAGTFCFICFNRYQYLYFSVSEAIYTGSSIAPDIFFVCVKFYLFTFSRFFEFEILPVHVLGFHENRTHDLHEATY